VTRYRRIWSGLLLCLCLFLPLRAVAQAPPAQEGVSLDFKDVELTDLIQTVSELTGRNFVYDDTVRGKVTIISPERISLDEAYQLFLTVLNVKGYTVVPTGNTNKIVMVKDAKENNLPTILEGGRRRSGDQYVTRLVPLQNVDANVLATSVLAPLIPKTSNIVAYPPSNTLIITDTASNIERLVQIIRELDVTSPPDNLEIISLQFASAEEVAKICNQILAQAAATPRRGRAAFNVQTAGGTTPSRIIPYERTNKLVVMASNDDMTTIKSILAQLDQKGEGERSHINVYYLENADAETLAKTLNEILTGIKAQTQTQGRTAAAQVAGQAAPLANTPVTITADKPTNSLVINSNPEDYEVIKGIIKQLDIKRKQVFVEALILELSMDATRRLGASLQGAVGINGDSVAFGTSNLNSGTTSGGTPITLGSVASGALLTQAIDGILLGGFFDPITITNPDGTTTTVPALSALIDVAKTDTDINILSAPRLLTSDNEEAEIVVGQNVPIITSRLTGATSSTDAANLAQSVTIERKDVALTLKLTPQITEGNLVRLTVSQELTDLAANSVGDVNQVGPTLTKRSISTTVVAENGRTIVLGGLIGNNVQKSVTKVPLLGDIPILGWLFKRTGTTTKKTNLLVFITPHVIHNADDLANVTRRSRDAMDEFRDKGVTPGWQIDQPPATAPQAEPGKDTTGK
jgi:general secretion pathway protein D